MSRILKTTKAAIEMTIGDIIDFFKTGIPRRINLFTQWIHEEWDWISDIGKWFIKWGPLIYLVFYLGKGWVVDDSSWTRILLWFPLSGIYLSLLVIIKRFVANIETVKRNRKKVADKL